jgi:hypothetical protein
MQHLLEKKKRKLPSERASRAKAKRAAICAHHQLNYIKAPRFLTFPTTPIPICPLRPISPSFPALTPMPATRPSYSISPPPASVPDCQTHQLPSHSHFPLLPCIPASLRSFCNSCHSCCHPSSVVSQPSQTPPCPTPSPPEGPDALAPAPSWPFARPPPKRDGSRRCSTSPKGREHQVSL